MIYMRKLQNSDEKIQRTKYMERYSMLMGRKIQHYQDDLTYRFNEISIKIPQSYFVDINKLMLKFI